MELKDIFNTEELDVINRCIEGELIDAFSRSDLKDKIMFFRMVSADSDITDMLTTLIQKVDRINDEQWNEMRFYLPTVLQYSEDDQPYDEVEVN